MILFEVNDDLHHLIKVAAGASGISMAAWLRQAADREIRRQAESQQKDGPPVKAALEGSHYV